MATPSPTESASPSPLPHDDDFARMVRAIAGSPSTTAELDEFWQWVIDVELTGLETTYTPPAAVVSYRTWQVPDTSCAIGQPAHIWRQAARYCPKDDSIYYDEDWLRDFRSTAGNFAPAAILAHEWGHHIQDLTGLDFSGDTRSIQFELQADCFAGMFVGAREKVVDGVWSLGVEDLTIATTTFFEMGNRRYDSSVWMRPNEHGSEFERMMAVGTGYLGALGEGAPLGRTSNFFPWCYGYESFQPDRFHDIGPYRLIIPPGRSSTGDESNFAIATLEALGRRGSSIELAWLAGAIDPIDIAAASAEQFPGLQIIFPNESHPLDPLPTGFGGVTYFYFAREDPSGTASGFYGVLPPTSSGTLGVMVSRPEPPVFDLSDPRSVALGEDLAAMAEVIGRLCGPGQSGTLGAGGFNAACADEQ